ncbi:MAG: hypothetical protein B7Z58_07155 [Acidiphilium sp. 37-64-53]|uniref:ATP-binding cassette domain-containing protein n=1 Tax=Acidiphilium TaxID=522 RepID=UPI000BCE6E9A|nr:MULTISPECIES: ABC transporter ATP-binding protein [Acidiphilium]OYW02633.1 MAG: hypothetical protein B7Z58_07155 [Acidiphilium sp. 37-64-53]OZB29921.1 MAG: hypothetical protein B7X49_05400 [Acidiphilium sp. 34-64-41]HQT83978.1 ABC transporter ATP-binding protein [Acidiphilium rubrum]
MPDANPPLLAVAGVAAGYGRTKIITGIDLTVHPGSFTAILGANGSGRSTLLRAISGQIPILAGTIRIAGIDLATAPEHAKRQFGYAVDPADLPPDLTGQQYLELIGSIRGCHPHAWPRDDLITTLQFGPWLRTNISAYSLGTRMKLSLMGALLGTPPLLLLDEALNGLDPLILARIRRLLAELCAAGHGLVMSTHMLATIGTTCTEMIMIESGRVAHRWTAPMIAAAGPAGLETMVVATLEGAVKPSVLF